MLNQAANNLAGIVNRLVQGYYSHLAAIEVASNPRAVDIAPPTLPGHVVPIGTVLRKDGTFHAFHFRYFLEKASKDPDIAADLPHVWLTGSLLTVGDALEHHSYFTRVPLLELVRHLRNGIAHGNHFDIRNPSQLQKYPAHNRDAEIHGDNKNIFEITPSLQGQKVLFDFMGPADILDVLMSVANYLVKLEEVP